MLSIRRPAVTDVATDFHGAFRWIRQFGTPAYDEGRAVAVDGASVYVAGVTLGALPGEMSKGEIDGFLRKYNRDGNLTWTRQFGTPALDHALAVAVDGSAVYVAGYTDDAGRKDAFLSKYDPEGNVLWSQPFGTNDIDYASAVAADASGAYVGGLTFGMFPNETGAGVDAFVRKYDPGGNLVWTRQFGTTGGDGASALAVSASGLYVAGWTTGVFPGYPTGSGSEDAFLRKYDPSGNPVWTRQFGTFDFDGANAVAVNGTRLYVAGVAGRDASLWRYSLDGNLEWARQAATEDEDIAWAIAASESSVFVSGATQGTFPGEVRAGGYDAFVGAYDAAGTELWTHQFGTSGRDFAWGIAADESFMFVAGVVEGALPGQTDAGGADAFLASVASIGTARTPIASPPYEAILTSLAATAIVVSATVVWDRRGRR